jgi:uncharacterized protein YlzI (FlbEa/FlbD family)
MLVRRITYKTCTITSIGTSLMTVLIKVTEPNGNPLLLDLTEISHIVDNIDIGSVIHMTDGRAYDVQEDANTIGTVSAMATKQNAS